MFAELIEAMAFWVYIDAYLRIVEHISVTILVGSMIGGVGYICYRLLRNTVDFT